MIYNVVLNSANRLAGTNVANAAFNFDWSNLEEGAYELTFSFNAFTVDTNEVIVVSCPDLGVASNVFTTKSAATAQSFNNVLGVICADSSYDYITPVTQNPPIHLQTRPHSSLLTIYLYTTAGVLVELPNDYVLILSLKKI
jgi:hypothetical protein